MYLERLLSDRPHVWDIAHKNLKCGIRHIIIGGVVLGNQGAHITAALRVKCIVATVDI